jgi:nitrogen-specific signal transduction histidine kinase/ActR/RegA family two-component response regulator
MTMNDDPENKTGDSIESMVNNSARFEIMRAIAGRIADEIGAHLTPLTSYPKIIRESLDPEDESLEFVYKIERAAKEIASVVRQLDLLAGRTKREPQMVDINAIADKIANQMKKRRDIFARSVACELTPDLAEVEGSPDDIRDAIENLCSNAVESLTEGGKFLIRTMNVKLGDSVSDCGLQIKAGDYVRVSVEDSGSGIPDDIKDRVFEPFVTSKKDTAARHSGLGLTVVFNIMRNHSGGIEYKTVRGVGSSFTLLFPAARTGRSTASKLRGPARAAALIPRNKARIMVVDNEKTILRLFKMILTEALPGTKIDFAEDGEEAVDKFSARHHAVIIMDIRMPVLDGHGAFKRMQQLCEEKGWEMPSIVFCTGFPAPDAVNELVLDNSAHGLLSKPVSGQTLIDTVRARLS